MLNILIYVNYVHNIVMHIMVLLVNLGHYSGGVYVTSGVR